MKDSVIQSMRCGVVVFGFWFFIQEGLEMACKPWRTSEGEWVLGKPPFGQPVPMFFALRVADCLNKLDGRLESTIRRLGPDVVRSHVIHAIEGMMNEALNYVAANGGKPTAVLGSAGTKDVPKYQYVKPREEWLRNRMHELSEAIKDKAFLGEPVSLGWTQELHNIVVELYGDDADV